MVAKTDLRVTIDADAAKFEKAIASARRDMMKFESQIRQADAAAADLDRQLNEQHERAVRGLGQGMLAFGAATVAGLGMAVKAAIEWETAWVGVVKVIEGTPQQLAELESQLRAIARTGFGHEEVASVAAAAGQLGVQTPNIAGFTKVMLDLGVATNMTAEEAAFSIARISNIMGTAAGDVERLGSVIVDLGNNSATTERDIVEMGLRIAGAGNTIGMSEADVLGFAAALSSVGIESQAGGTAISKVMIQIANAVAEGGDSVEAFADVAGVSTQRFARAFEEDPAAAIAMFVTGLGEINESGGNVFATLEELGMSEIRVRDAMLRMSGAGDLLTDSLGRGGEAWADNTALIEEAERRYDTAEVKIQAAKSTLFDLAIEIGNVLLPAFVGVVEFGRDLIQTFIDLPGPVKTLITVLGALLGSASLLGGAFLLMGPKIAAARANIAHFARVAPVATGAALTLGGALTKLGLAAAGFFIATQALEAFGFTAQNTLRGVDSASQSIAWRLAEMTTGAGGFSVGVNEATEALLNLADGMRTDVAEGKGIEDTMLRVLSRVKEMDEVSDEAREQLGAFDAALAHIATSGSAGQAEESLTAIQRALGLTDDEMKELVNKAFPQYRDALAANRNDERQAVEQIVEVDEALIDLAARFNLAGDDAEAAARKMLDEWSKSSGSFVSLVSAYSEALSGLEEAERDRAQAVADSTEDATDSWEDHYNDVKVTIGDFIEMLDEQIAAQRNWHENMAYLATRVSDDMFAELARLGPEGAPLVQALVDGGEEKLREADEKWQTATATATTGITGELAKARPELEKIALEHGQAVADEIAAGMVANSTTVKEEAENLGIDIDEGVGRDVVRDIPVQVTGVPEVTEKLISIRDIINSFPKKMTVAIDAQGNVRTHDPGSTQPALAMGGPVNGPGTATSDSIALWGSDGEWMMRAAARRKYGDKAMAAINAGIADVYVPGMGGPLSSVHVDINSSKLNPSDYRTMRDQTLAGAARGAAMGAASAAGKVLPPGSYRVGRGPAGHGYNARDLPAPTGTPIYAAAAGMVSSAARLATSYGIHARLQHAGFRTLYAHMSQMYIRAGQQVARGQMIGRVGSTGNSTGPHLHLEPDLPRLYDTGGMLPPGITTVMNGTGGFERVLNRAETQAVGGKGLPDSLKDLRNASKDMKAFADALAKLARRGLSQAALASIHGAGPDRGLEQARALLKRGPGGIADMNAWQRRQDRAQRRADRMFEEPDPGTPKSVFRDISKAAGASFVKGIVGSRDDIRRSFEPLFKSIGEVVERPMRNRLMGLAKDARRELLTLGRQWERVTDRLAKANDKLQQLKDSAKQLRGSVRDRIVGAADVTQMMVQRRMADKDGGYIKEDRSIKAITETLRAERDQARKMADAVEKLRKRGLNDTTLQQIVAAGPEDGLRTAEEILKGGKGGIEEINTLTRQLSNAGNKLGQTAADSMYKAGIQTAEGLIKGLEKEQKRLERLMARIADSLVNRIKKQLKIKSPSQVFADEVGAPIGQGIAAGVLSAEDQVLAATREVIDGAAKDMPRWADAEFSAPRAWVRLGGPGPVPHGTNGDAGDTYNLYYPSEEILVRLEERKAHAAIVRGRPD